MVPKNHEPKVFTGARNEDFQNWAKKLKNYCNATKTGFKMMLEWAEMLKEPIERDDLELYSWEHAEDADIILHDYLTMVTAGDALRIIEAYEGRGFEAWRQLKLRYNPEGGRHQLDRMTMMLHRKPCKDITELPAAIDKLAKDIRVYELHSDKVFPPEWKIPLLRDILPAACKKEIEMKYTMGEKDYSKMAENIKGFANETRVTQSRGVMDMEVDHVCPETPANEWTDAEWYDYIVSDAVYAEIGYIGHGKKGNGGK